MAKSYNFYKLYRKGLRHSLVRTDRTYLGEFVEFLEEDPYSFGTGYAKEKIWKYIWRYDLSDKQQKSLERAALKYLGRPMSREFRPMSKCMCRIGTQSFWNKVRHQLKSNSPMTRLNAACLHPYSEGMAVGEFYRMTMRSYYWYGRRPQGHLRVYHANDLLDLMKAPRNWRNGKIVQVETNLVDLPIIDPMVTEMEKSLVWLQFEHSRKTHILDMLKVILTSGIATIFSENAWHYCLYALCRIDDERAVPIVNQFIHNWDFFELSIKDKDRLLMACLKVLRHYNTLEALDTLETYKEMDDKFSRNFSENGNGWLRTYPKVREI